MTFRDNIRILRTHTAYASMSLSTALLLLEYILPGSVLPYVPLLPLTIGSFLLLMFLPKQERIWKKTQSVMTVLILALLSLLLFFTLRDARGGSILWLILAILITMILGGYILSHQD